MRSASKLLLLALLLATAGTADTTPKTKNLGAEPPRTALYVGNSFFYYNNGMSGIVGRLLGAADPEHRAQYRSTSVTISGSGLNWHDVESYFKPGMASYSFTPDNKVVFNKFERPFDVVIMNDCSQCPIHPQLKDAFHEYARRHSATVRKHGAKPVLFMTWAYADKPEMTAQLAEQYTIAGNANDALVVPAGLAFARSVARDPQINLYDPDKRHPSLAGSYLAACTILASVHGKTPVGNSHTGGLDPKVAAFLQQVADETVKEYFGAAARADVHPERAGQR
jgi:hypothetical protein